DEAGFPKGAGGMRFKVRLDYQATGESGALQSAADIMREQLRAVGVDLQLRPMDGATYIDVATKWDFDLTMASFGTGPDPAIAVSRNFITDQILHIFPGNVMAYSNPKVDDLLNRADSELNINARAKYYQDAQAILVDELPALWLWEKYYPLAVRKGLVGLP